MASVKRGYDLSYVVYKLPSTVAAEKLFSYDVTSSLPFAESLRRGPRDLKVYKGYMIDDERLIGMRVRQIVIASLDSVHSPYEHRISQRRALMILKSLFFDTQSTITRIIPTRASI